MGLTSFAFLQESYQELTISHRLRLCPGHQALKSLRCATTGFKYKSKCAAPRHGSAEGTFGQISPSYTALLNLSDEVSVLEGPHSLYPMGSEIHNTETSIATPPNISWILKTTAHISDVPVWYILDTLCPKQNLDPRGCSRSTSTDT